MLPTMAGTSAIGQPRHRALVTLRLEKLDERARTRSGTGSLVLRPAAQFVRKCHHRQHDLRGRPLPGTFVQCCFAVGVRSAMVVIITTVATMIRAARATEPGAVIAWSLTT